MIDTIKLAIPTSKVKFTSYTGYKNISEKALKKLVTNNGYNNDDAPDYVNYEKIYIHDNGYLPAIGISAYKQGEPMLWIRVSLPKLLHKTNIYEICEKDYTNVVQQIKTTTSKLCVDIPDKAIYEALIWEIHLGKNVDLNSTGLTCECTLSALNKLAFDKRLSQNKVYYLNVLDDTDKMQIEYEEGEKWGIGCTSYEYCCYVKTKEVLKDSWGQKFIKEHPELNNVLRLEYRLYHSQAVKKAFDKVGISKNICFGDFFKDINFKLLNLFIWNKVIKPQICWLGFIDNDPMVLLTKMNSLNIKPMNRLKLLGLFYTNLTENSCSTIKMLFPARSNVLKRLEQQIEAIDGLETYGLINAFKYIELELIRNQPLT